MNGRTKQMRRAGSLWGAAAALIALSSTGVAAQDATTSPVPLFQVGTTEGTGDRVNPQSIEIQYFRPHDARGMNMFETPKIAGAPYDGFKLKLGAAFTQQYQDLHDSNEAVAKTVNNVNVNQLMPIGAGFNNAVANLYIDAQLARGIRLAMTSFLSSRHHQETWVKDGYLLIDESPYHTELLDNLMKALTLRVGHFEINYGDMHFRRTDNGNAMYNPLVGNLIMDAFTTEIGAEAYLRGHGLMAMVGATGGEVRGNVEKPAQRAPTLLSKVGFDRQISPDMRVRVTGSLYTTKKSLNNTLYSGDRAGSRYYEVLENTLATTNAQAWSGNLQPGFSNMVTAVVLNPFVKVRGLELFGNIEQANGNKAGEAGHRTWHQYAGEGVYRFAANQLYVAGRYNTANGRLAGQAQDVRIQRVQAGGGWFITPNIEMKGEYVRQTYKDFPTDDIRSGGKFNGAMIEGVVAF